MIKETVEVVVNKQQAMVNRQHGNVNTFFASSPKERFLKSPVQGVFPQKRASSAYNKKGILCIEFFYRNSFDLLYCKVEKMQGATDTKTQKKIKMQVELYNMIPNLLWSLISLIPVGYFCYYLLPRSLLYVFLGISLTGYLLPASFYNRIQIKNLNFFKRAGVPFAQRYAQNGTIINRVIRKKIPGYKLNYDRKTLEAQYKRTYGFEKFHFVALLFFLLTTLFALTASYYLWSLILTVTNIIYNVYPILLQHYTRLRISSLLNRKR